MMRTTWVVFPLVVALQLIAARPATAISELSFEILSATRVVDVRIEYYFYQQQYSAYDSDFTRDLGVWEASVEATISEPLLYSSGTLTHRSTLASDEISMEGELSGPLCCGLGYTELETTFLVGESGGYRLEVGTSAPTLIDVYLSGSDGTLERNRGEAPSTPVELTAGVEYRLRVSFDYIERVGTYYFVLVPEPESGLLMFLGLAGLVSNEARARRNRRCRPC